MKPQATSGTTATGTTETGTTATGTTATGTTATGTTATGNAATGNDRGNPTARQRAGGIAAHVVAGTYVIGFVAMVFVLVPLGFTDALTDPRASLDFLTEWPLALYAWYLVLYLIGGAALPVVVLALHDRLRPTGPTWVSTGTAFGLIWSGLLLASGMIALVGQRSVTDLASTDRPGAVASWHAVSTVQDALGGGIELVGALWLLITCLAALRTRALPRALALLGLPIGLAGLATVIPAIAEIPAALFGIGLIVWFTWTGQTLLTRPKTRRGETPTHAEQHETNAVRRTT